MDATIPPRIRAAGNRNGPRAGGRNAARRNGTPTKQTDGHHRGAVGAERHEAGVGTRELAHVAVYHVQAQGEHDGDQGEAEHEDPVVADPRPDVQDGVQQHQVNGRGDTSGNRKSEAESPFAGEMQSRVTTAAGTT